VATLSAVALFAATFATAASSAAVATVASSVVLISAAFSATAAAVETSLTVEADPLPLDPPGAINTAIGSGCGVVAAPGACCPTAGVR
jgi:hypothetical protein